MTHKKKAPTRAKVAYETPSLKVHGDLKSSTLVKKGKFADGGVKPKTRASGGNT